MSAIEEAKKSKQETWDNIRGIELSDADLKDLSDESPIFKKYRTVTTLDRAIKELSDPDLVSKAADLVWRLANRVIAVVVSIASIRSVIDAYETSHSKN